MDVRHSLDGKFNDSNVIISIKVFVKYFQFKVKTLCKYIQKNCFSDNMAKACMVGLSYTHADVYSACNSTYHVNCEVKNNHRQLLLQCSPLIIVESEITEACFLTNNK